jgi:MFS family permease
MDFRSKLRSLRSLDWINACCADFQMASAAYIAIFLATERHWTPGQIGLAIGAQNLATMAVQVPFGAWIDRSAYKKWLVIGAAILAAIGCVWALVANGLANQSAAQVVIGVASAMFAPAIAALSLGIVGREKLSARVGRNEMFNHAGKLLLALLGGASGLYFGTQYSLYAIILFALGGASAGLMLRSGDVDDSVARGSEEGKKNAPAVPMGEFLKRRAVWVFVISVIFFHLANAAMLQVIGQQLAKGQEKQSSLYVSACIGVAQAVMIPMAFATSKLIAKVGRKPLFLCVYVVVAVRAALFAVIHSKGWLIAIQSLDGVASAMFGVLWTIIDSDIAQGTGRFGTMQGMIACAWYLGAATGNLVTGVVATRFGFSKGFLLESGFAVLGAIWFLVLMPETSASQKPIVSVQAAT